MAKKIVLSAVPGFVRNLDAIMVDPAKIFIRQGWNPRKSMSEDGLELLMASIEEHGVRQPLTIFPEAEYFWAVNGHRRLECIRRLKERGIEIKAVPCIISRAMSEQDRIIESLVDNEFSEPLSPMDTAQAIHRLEVYGFSVAEIAKKLSRSEVWCYQHLELLGAEKELAAEVDKKKLSIRSAIDIIRAAKASGTAQEDVPRPSDKRSPLGKLQTLVANAKIYNTDIKKYTDNGLQSQHLPQAEECWSQAVSQGEKLQASHQEAIKIASKRPGDQTFQELVQDIASLQKKASRGILALETHIEKLDRDREEAMPVSPDASDGQYLGSIGQNEPFFGDTPGKDTSSEKNGLNDMSRACTDVSEDSSTQEPYTRGKSLTVTSPVIPGKAINGLPSDSFHVQLVKEGIREHDFTDPWNRLQAELAAYFTSLLSTPGYSLAMVCQWLFATYGKDALRDALKVGLAAHEKPVSPPVSGGEDTPPVMPPATKAKAGKPVLVVPVSLGGAGSAQAALAALPGPASE